jgi:hypothetical protein
VALCKHQAHRQPHHLNVGRFARPHLWFRLQIALHKYRAHRQLHHLSICQFTRPRLFALRKHRAHRQLHLNSHQSIHPCLLACPCQCLRPTSHLPIYRHGHSMPSMFATIFWRSRWHRQKRVRHRGQLEVGEMSGIFACGCSWSSSNNRAFQ